VVEGKINILFYSYLLNFPPKAHCRSLPPPKKTRVKGIGTSLHGR
jgi:hypothetical protein